MVLGVRDGAVLTGTVAVSTDTLSEPQVRALRLLRENEPLNIVTARRFLISENTLRSLVHKGLVAYEGPSARNRWSSKWTVAP